MLSADFDAYRPEADLDTQNRVHVAGYGFRGAPRCSRGPPEGTT